MDRVNILYNNLTAEDPKIIQDERIKINLKEHQKTAIHAMLKFEETGKVSFTKKMMLQHYNLYDQDYYEKYYGGYWNKQYNKNNEKFKEMKMEIETNYGILADKVGAGKTFMTMGMIVYNQIPKERDRIINSSIYTVTKYKDTEVPKKTNLIIVPHNLSHQWKQAFEYCTLKTYKISKRSDVDNLVYEDNIFANKPAAPDADYNETNCVCYYDVIIISATMFELFYEKFNTIKWARIIIDEVVTIKLPSDLEFKCNFIWFITATPSGIRYVRRNYVRDLVSTMKDYVMNNIIIKNDDEFVDQSMHLPNINQIIIKCLTPKELNIVKEYVDGDIINMINGGDIQGAITKLNCNIETSESILDVVTKKIKKELHNRKKELEYEQKVIPDNQKTHDEKIRHIQAKIKELENKCEGIETRIKSFKEEHCPICYEEFISPLLTPCCNNLFCLKCLSLCQVCPMCRSEIDIKKCTIISDTKLKESKEIKEKTLCTKADNLITLIKTKPNGKFLVFSNYDRTFENLNEKLTDNGIKYNRLVGSNVVINSILRKFNSGDIKVLMLNAINYGSGLNLQMATDIIIYHELDMELETQVIGRAQRLGRKEPLNVYYLLNEHEKVNCKSPTLNLDIFNNDVTMLEQFMNNKIDTNLINLDDNDNTSTTENDENINNLGRLVKVKRNKKKEKMSEKIKKVSKKGSNQIINKKIKKGSKKKSKGSKKESNNEKNIVHPKTIKYIKPEIEEPKIEEPEIDIEFEINKIDNIYKMLEARKNEQQLIDPNEQIFKQKIIEQPIEQPIEKTNINNIIMQTIKLEDIVGKPIKKLTTKKLVVKKVVKK